MKLNDPAYIYKKLIFYPILIQYIYTYVYINASPRITYKNIDIYNDMYNDTHNDTCYDV